jgi:hypothetical protein
LYQYLKEAIMPLWASRDPFLFSLIYLNCLNSLFVITVRTTLNLIPINMASPELNLQLPIWWRFLTFWLLLTATSVKMMLSILIFQMLSTSSLVIRSCIN